MLHPSQNTHWEKGAATATQYLRTLREQAFLLLVRFFLEFGETSGQSIDRPIRRVK
jgi:hypothetical protein